MKKAILFLAAIALLVVLFLNFMPIKVDVIEVEESETKTTNQEENNESAKEGMDKTKFVDFSMKDLDGNEVTEQIFGQSEITIVNIWGTTCPPCIEELPELQKLTEEFDSSELQVIGLVADANDVAAKEIVESVGSNFVNLIPNADVFDSFLRYIQFTPTSVYVDKEGYILGEPDVGGKGIEYFRNKVNDFLDKSNASSDEEVVKTQQVKACGTGGTPTPTDEQSIHVLPPDFS